MAEIINFRHARKRKLQAEKERLAAERRARFGRPKAERTLAEARAERARRDLDARKREPDPKP